MTELSTILDQIDSGSILLPEFQRGYVWNRDQVRGLMRSLYRDYPVGGLLLWQTDSDSASVRGESGGSGLRHLLLDGQQRITSLYGVIRGHAPAFFEGDTSAFTGLHFNVEDEKFEFYAPAKMRGDDRWVDVTSLFGPSGLDPYFAKFGADSATATVYLPRLNRLLLILKKNFHEEKVTGKDKTIDMVVEIFNRSIPAAPR